MFFKLPLKRHSSQGRTNAAKKRFSNFTHVLLDSCHCCNCCGDRPCRRSGMRHRTLPLFSDHKHFSTVRIDFYLTACTFKCQKIVWTKLIIFFPSHPSLPMCVLKAHGRLHLAGFRSSWKCPWPTSSDFIWLVLGLRSTPIARKCITNPENRDTTHLEASNNNDNEEEPEILPIVEPPAAWVPRDFHNAKHGSYCSAPETGPRMTLLMVQKSGGHQLRLVVLSHYL